MEHFSLLLPNSYLFHSGRGKPDNWQKRTRREPQFWPLCVAGGIGAALGDWVSYWFGYRYKEHVAQMWPLSRYPEILPRGEAFVKRWGVPSIFIGRFFGPLRASVPLAAGIFEMPYWQFQIANFVSAFVWAAALLLFGDVIAQIAEWIWRAV